MDLLDSEGPFGVAFVLGKVVVFAHLGVERTGDKSGSNGRSAIQTGTQVIARGSPNSRISIGQVTSWSEGSAHCGRETVIGHDAQNPRRVHGAHVLERKSTLSYPMRAMSGTRRSASAVVSGEVHSQVLPRCASSDPTQTLPPSRGERQSRGAAAWIYRDKRLAPETLRSLLETWTGNFRKGQGRVLGLA